MSRLLTPGDIHIVHDHAESGYGVVRTNIREIVYSCRINHDTRLTHDKILAELMREVRDYFLYRSLDEYSFQSMKRFMIEYLNKMILDGVITYG